MGWHNVLGIQTCYGFQGPAIESRCGRDFPPPSRPALGTGSSPEVKRLGVALTTQLHLAPRLKKGCSCTCIHLSGVSWPVLRWNLTLPCLIVKLFMTTWRKRVDTGIEGESARLHSVENSLWKGLFTCRQTENSVNEWMELVMVESGEWYWLSLSWSSEVWMDRISFFPSFSLSSVSFISCLSVCSSFLSSFLIYILLFFFLSFFLLSSFFISAFFLSFFLSVGRCVRTTALYHFCTLQLPQTPVHNRLK